MPKLGMVLYHGIEGGPELANYARIAEKSGFNSLWVTERYFHEETFTLLGYLAAATKRIKLGVGVVNPYTRSPALTAMAAATLDRLSAGRFLLGIGRSERAVIEDRMGIHYGNSLGRLESCVKDIRKLLKGEQVSQEHAASGLRNARLTSPPLKDNVPIYLAAIGPKALRLAGAVGDGVLLNAYTPVNYVKYAVDEVRRGALDAGRDPESLDIVCMLVVRLTDSPEDLFPELQRRVVRLLAEQYVGEILLEKGGFDPSILPPLRLAAGQNREEEAMQLVSYEMVKSFYLVGNEAQLQQRIAQYREAGVGMPLLLPRLDDFKRVAEALGQS